MQKGEINKDNEVMTCSRNYNKIGMARGETMSGEVGQTHE